VGSPSARRERLWRVVRSAAREVPPEPGGRRPGWPEGCDPPPGSLASAGSGTSGREHKKTVHQGFWWTVVIRKGRIRFCRSKAVHSKPARKNEPARGQKNYHPRTGAATLSGRLFYWCDRVSNRPDRGPQFNRPHLRERVGRDAPTAETGLRTLTFCWRVDRSFRAWRVLHGRQQKNRPMRQS